MHKIEHGYGVVELSGKGSNDLEVTITWKGRVFDSSENNYKYLPIPEKISYKAEPKVLSVKNIEGDKILIYPNPAEDFIRLSGYTGEIQIVDLMGNKIWRFQPDNENKIDVSRLQKGFFFLKIGGIDNFKVIKFIKQ
jgi:hypothetical protein